MTSATPTDQKVFTEANEGHRHHLQALKSTVTHCLEFADSGQACTFLLAGCSKARSTSRNLIEAIFIGGSCCNAND